MQLAIGTIFVFGHDVQLQLTHLYDVKEKDDFIDDANIMRNTSINIQKLLLSRLVNCKTYTYRFENKKSR